MIPEITPLNTRISPSFLGGVAPTWSLQPVDMQGICMGANVAYEDGINEI